MTNEEIIQHIVQGIISLKLDGDYDMVDVSPHTEYPRIGIAGWTLDEADTLLELIPHGFYFEDLPYLKVMENVKPLKRMLSSVYGRQMQVKYLTQQINTNVEYLKRFGHLTNDYALIYVGIWSITSVSNIYSFLNNYEKNYNINDVDILHQLFIDKYRLNNYIKFNEKDRKLLKKRGEKTFRYVKSL